MSSITKSLRRKLQRLGPLDIYFANLSGEDRLNSEYCFLNWLELANGTFKTTAPRRLDDVNALVTDVLTRKMPSDPPLAVMDVAVSSGVSTAEWSDHLTAMGIEHCIDATDLAVDAVLMTVGRHWAIMWQYGGHPLAVQARRYTVYFVRPRLGFGLMRLLITASLTLPLRFLYAVATKVLRETRYTDGTLDSSVRVTRVPLVSSTVIANSNIRVIQDDIMEPGKFLGQVDICRAANVLNREYFPDKTIALMARNLLTRVRDDGLLVVCRTTNETANGRVNLATVLRKRSASVEVVGRLNGGCDVEDLLLSAARRNYGR
jgi:hypothetical protein